MSNRRFRNDVKAQRRFNKVLAGVYVHPGYEIFISTADFNNRLTMCISRQSDGFRLGVCYVADRLWRHMAQVTDVMFETLVEMMGREPQHTHG